MDQFRIWVAIVIISMGQSLVAGVLDAYGWTLFGKLVSATYPNVSLWGFQQAREALPNHPHTRFNEAMALSRVGRSNDGIACLLHIDSTRLSPADRSKQYQWLSFLYEQKQQVLLALEWSRKAVMATPGSPEAVFQLHRLMLQSERYEKARQMTPLSSEFQHRLFHTVYEVELEHRMSRLGHSNRPKGAIHW